MKALIIFGTRPETITMVPVVRELEKPYDIEVCVTAQHHEILDKCLVYFKL